MAPVRRDLSPPPPAAQNLKAVTAVDTPVAYQPDSEDFILPQTEDVAAALRRILEY